MTTIPKGGELPKLMAKAATASIEMDEETIIISKRTENCLLYKCISKIKETIKLIFYLIERVVGRYKSDSLRHN